MSFLSDFKNYLLSQKEPSSRITVKNYLADISKFVRWFETKFGEFLPERVTPQIISQFKASQSSSPASVERYLSSLRKFFNFLKLEGIISESPLEIENLKLKIEPDPWHLKDFKNYLYVYNASRLTIKNYLIDVKHFLSWTETVLNPSTEWEVSKKDLLARIDAKLIEEYKRRLIHPSNDDPGLPRQQAGFSPATVNRKLSSLRRYLRWAIETGLISENSEKLRIPDGQKIRKSDLSVSPNRRSADSPSIPSYSGFPPLRLVQKSVGAGLFLFELAFINPPVYVLKTIEHLVWNLQGRPVFSKPEIRNSKLEIRNLPKAFYAPLSLSTAGLPIYKRLYLKLRHNRPNWYKAYHSYPLSHYLHYAILIVFMSALGFGLYQNFYKKPSLDQAVLAATPPTGNPRILSFQGKLTDSSDNPITVPTDLRFTIYDSVTASGSALQWQEVNTVTPDQDGIFSLMLGTKTDLGQSLFANHAGLWLGVTVGKTPELTPRQQLATVAYAENADTLQGLPPITQPSADTKNVVLALDSSGNLTIGGSATPTFQATGGQFKISGNPLLLTTTAGSNGNVTVNPDGRSFIDLQKPIQNSTNNNNISTAKGAVEINDLFAVLATSSGQSAVTVNQNGAGPIISASSSGIAKFTVDNSGNTTIAGNVSLTGTNPSLSVAGTNSLSIDAGGSGAVSIAGTSTGDVNLAGGSGNTGCTVANATGNLTCTGSLNGGSTGSVSAGTFLAGNGTAAAPSYAFTNSTGTGLYRVGADILGITTAGTQRATYDASGNYTLTGGNTSLTSTTTTGTAFSLTDTALTSGTLANMPLTANAGNGQTTIGQAIAITDATTGGGGYTGLSVNITGTGVGTGNKFLLDLNPGDVNKEIIVDSSGALRPTQSVATNTTSIGNASFYFKNGFFDQITANTISGNLAGGGTSSVTWTIGDTQTGDVNEALIFQRNSGSGNATLQWNAGAGDLRYLTVNYPFNSTYTVSDTSIGTGVNLYSGTLTNNTTSGTQKLLSLTNTGTGTTENGIYVNNTGTGTTGIEIAGTWTTGLSTNNNSINAGTGAITSGAITTSGNFLQTGSTTFTTGSGAVSLNGDTTLASNKSLAVSGTGTITDSFQNTTGSAFSSSVTNTATSGLNNTTNAYNVSLTGTANLTGSNVLNGINFVTPTAATNNTFVGLNFNAGYTTLISSSNFTVTGAGALTAASISTTGNISNSGVFLAANGSAAAPSYAFTNSTGTGLFRGGTDILGISTAGSQRVTIDATGNVGIGTTSPTAKLHVSGSSDQIQEIIKANSTQTSNIMEWQNSAGLTLLKVAPSGGTQNVSLSPGGTAFGDLGASSARWNSIYGYALDLNSGSAQPSAIGMAPSNGTTLAIASDAATWVPLYIKGAASQSADLFEWANSSGTVLGVINSSGNVGIGTTGPSTLLDVNGVTTLRGNLLFGTDNTYDIGASGANRPRDIWVGRNIQIDSKLNLGGTNTDYIALGQNPATTGLIRLQNSLGIYGRNAANTADGLIIATNNNNILIGDSTFANVGIGTTNPQEKLALSSASNFGIEMGVPTMGTVTCSTTGGSLGGGVTYFFKVTASDSRTATTSTTGSSEGSCAMAATTTGSVAVNYTAPTGGAQGFRIYKGTSTAGEDRYQVSTSQTSFTYTTDTGATLGSVPTTTNSYSTNLANNNSLIIGNLSSPGLGSEAQDSEKFGLGATASSMNSLAIGKNANAACTIAGNSVGCIAIGYGASATGGNTTTVIGYNASGSSLSSTIIGAQATSTFESSVALGYTASVTGLAGTALGSGATAGNSSVAIGSSSSAASIASIAIGSGASTTATQQAVFTNTSGGISNVYFGSGVTNASPIAYTINGTGGSGTNIAGGAVQLAGGQGTGTGAGGSIIFRTAAAGATGSSLNTLSDRMTIDSNGNVGIGTTSPSQLLTVNSGQLYVTGSQVSGGAGVYTDYSVTTGNGNSYGIRSLPTIANTNTGTLYANWAGAIVNTGVTQTNYYGNYIAAPTLNGTGAITNKYAFVTEASAGNVGIGTTSPGVKLVVAGTTSATSAIKVANTDTTGTANISLGEVATDATTPFYIQRTGSTAVSNANGVDIWNANNGFMRFATNNTERMRIDSSGNVGIGIIPSDKLDVFLPTDTAVAFTNGSGGAGDRIVIQARNSGQGNVPIIDMLNEETNGKRNIIMDTTNGLEFNDVTGTSSWIFRTNAGTQRFKIPNTISPAANGVAYSTDANGTLAFTATGGAGTLCLTSASGAAPAWGACSGSAATAWSSLTNPSANLALTMGANTSTFTYNAATGANDLFKLTDTANNTGTGYLLNVTTAAGSAATPVHIVQTASNKQGLVVDTGGGSNAGIVLRDNGNNARTVQLNQDGNGGYITGGNLGTGASNGLFIEGLSSTLRLVTDAANPITFATNNTVRMTLDSTGNLGIGTASPATIFHISAASGDGETISSTTTVGQNAGVFNLGFWTPTAADQRLGYYIFGTRPASTTRSAASIEAYSNAAWTDGTSQPTYLSFFTTAASSATRLERVRIDPSGNVGIGTTAPQQLLHIKAAAGVNALERIESGGSGATTPRLEFYAAGTLQAQILGDGTGLYLDTGNANSTFLRSNGTNKLAVANTTSPAVNGIPYSTDTSGTIQYTATGGAGTLCLVSTAGGAPTWGSCAGSAATSWSSLSNPSANLSLSMGANTTTFTWNSTTGSNNLLTLTDTANNTGTGKILQITSASGSNTIPLDVKAGTVNGDVAVFETNNGSGGDIKFFDANLSVPRGYLGHGGNIANGALISDFVLRSEAALKFVTGGAGAVRTAFDSTGNITLTPGVSTSGSPTLLALTAPAHTTLAASTEATDVNLNLARTVQFSTGNIGTQRAVRIQAPTYGFVGASTITTAATLDISGAPIAGTNATLSDPLALFIESGNVALNGGRLRISGTNSAVNSIGILMDQTMSDGTGTNVGIISQPTFSSTINAVEGIQTNLGTSASAITVSSMYNVYIANPRKGAGSTITNNYGLITEAQTSGTNNWAIYTSGTTQSYFGGNIGIGVTVPTQALDVNGNIRVRNLSQANGVLYSDSTGLVTQTATGGAGTLCLTSTNGGSPVFASCAGSGGTTTTAWSSLGGPAANLSMSMAAYTTTLTWNSLTGTSNLFNLTDSGNNNGTGYLLNLTTAAGSTLNPLHVSVNNGTEALAVASSGNVGIGTTSPAAKLDVNGTASIVDTLTINSVNVAANVNAGVNTLSLISGTNTKIVLSQATGFITQTVQGVERMRIDSSGNVGIGTTGPTSPLHVVGSSSNLSGASQTGAIIDSTFTSAATTQGVGLQINYGAVASSFTMTNLYGLIINPTTPVGTTPTITNWYGAYIGQANLNGKPVTNSYSLYAAPNANAGKSYGVYVNNGGYPNNSAGGFAISICGSGGGGSVVGCNLALGTDNNGVSNGQIGNMIAIANSNNTPGATAGQGFIYVSSGALKYQGPTTLTTLANADYAESMPFIGELNQAEIASISNVANPNSDLYNKFYIQRTSVSYDPNIVGVVSSASPETKTDTRQIAMIGRVPVKSTNENGVVKAGDYLTSSAKMPGYAMKATKAGRVIGVALNDFEQGSCTTSSSNFGLIGTLCTGQVLVFVNPGYYDANPPIITTIETAATYVISKLSSGTYQVKDAAGNLVGQAQVLASAVIGQVNAGIVKTQELVADKISAGQVTSPLAVVNKIKTDELSNLTSDKVAIKLENPTGSPSAKPRLEIQNASGSAVTTFDDHGNASLSGQLSASNLNSNSASVSGTLKAKNVQADNIDAAIANLKKDITNLTPVSVASYSGTLTTVENLTATTAIFSQGFSSLGPASLVNTSIFGQLSISGTLILADNSINVLGGDLNFQPLKQGGVSFLSGKIYISSNGELTVSGNATIKGNLYANIISPIPGQDLFVKLLQKNATESAQFKVLNASGSAVLAVNDKGDLTSSGSAKFNELLGKTFNIVREAQADTSLNETVASSSAGFATIVAGQLERTIITPYVLGNSLIYLSPVSDTQRETPYIARQTVEDKNLGTKASFTIRISKAVSQDIRLNWWIIN